jgi:hypothetical protein
MRSKPLPWAFVSLAGVPGRSLMATMPATLPSSTSSVTSNVSLPSSRTCTVQAPAKQSACSSRSIVRPRKPARAWTAWANSWANTMPMVKGPNVSSSQGMSEASSQAIRSVSSQYTALSRSSS